VRRIEDLRGKVVAVNARGSAVAAAVTLMMRRHGMEAGRDYQVVEVRFPAMLPALESKRVSLAYLLRPWNQAAAKNPNFMPLFGPGEVYGPSETGIWAVYADFLAKNRAALVDFLEDDMRMRRWAHDPKTRMEAVTLMAKISKRPVEGISDLYTKDENAFRHPDARVDVERLQKNVNHMHEAEVVPDTIDVKKYVDMSLVRDAKARLAR
jgi:NitT/TauT family transport system substrate-binding protein